MPLNLASPGIVVREVDLTQGRIDSSTNKTGGIVGAFAQGPVELPTLVGNENDLLNNFGQPYGSDKQYETWMVASSFLAYGGSLRVVRSDDDDLKNAVDSSNSSTSIKIKSVDHYEELGYDENVVPNVIVTGKNPGSWANGVRVAILDCKADQILELASSGIATVGLGVTQAIDSVLPGVGAGTTLDGVLKGIITQVEGAQAYVKVVSHVSAAGTETAVDYQQNGIYKFGTEYNITVVNNSGVAAAHTSVNATADWFDQQTLATSTSNVGVGTSVATVKWNVLADRPGTSDYAAARGARFDELHVVVLDGDGKITGNAGTVLEKHLNLSKAKDAEFSVGSLQHIGESI